MSKIKPYPKYKDSGIEWLGEMPEGWGNTEVRWTFQRAKVTNCPTETLLSVYRDYGVIPKDSRDDNWNRESEDLSAYQLVCEGDLVTNKMKAWQGSIAVSSFRGIVSPAYYVYKSIHSERNEYFHYLLRSKPYILHYGIISKGIRVNQWDLEHEAFRLTPILLPSKKEQQAIAAYLDRETSHIDALIAKKTRSIEILREKRQAMITQAVTKGLNPNAKMKDSGIEWIGEVPEGWDIGKVAYGFNVLLGKMLQPQPQSNHDKSVPYYRSANVQWEKITGKIEEMWASTGDLEKYAVKTGDLLVCEGGEAGRSAIVTNVENYPTIIQNAVHRVRALLGFDTKFLLRFLQAVSSAGWIYILCNKSTISHFTQEKFNELVCTFPPLLEQQAIAAYLDENCAKIDSIISKTERSIELLKEKRQALITAAVTGKIDVREAVC